MDPRSATTIGGYYGAHRLPMVTFLAAPQERVAIPLLVGTSSFDPDLGYAVPAGQWMVYATLELSDGTAANTPLLTDYGSARMTRRPAPIDPIWHGDGMTMESRHISVWVSRSAQAVYAYASEPANLPQWAAGLASSVADVDGRWVAESPMGRVAFAFGPRNEYGVLDHHVTLPSGDVVYNPMRVIAGGQDCEVLFTVRRRPGMSDEDFASDAAAVAADLGTLKRVLERPQHGTTQPLP